MPGRLAVGGAVGGLAGCVLALILTLSPSRLHAQAVTANASLTAERVRAGETTVLRIVVETRGEDADISVRLPPELLIISTQDFSQLQVLNSTRTRQIRRDMVLRALAAGRYTIGSAVVLVNNETYTTEPLELVVEAGGGAAPASSTSDVDVRLRAWLEPAEVYVGEQILLYAEALFAGDLRQRQSRPASYEAPSPTGFWVQDLDVPVTAGARLINGDVYESQTFRRVYFPLEVGRFTIEPARLVYELRRGLLQPPESHELVSDSLDVVVRPLPVAGRPASFTGAVGRFDIRASLEPRSIAVGGAATLTVELSGVGNIKALPPPDLPGLDGVEVFPPSEQADVSVVDNVVRGTKRFSWVIVPSEEEPLDIGPIEYAYFDPDNERFENASSGSLTLDVGPVRDVVLDPSGIAPLRDAPSSTGLAWVSSPLFLALQIVPLLLISATVVRGRGWLTGRGEHAELRNRKRNRSARLDALRSTALKGGPDFFFVIDETVREAVADAVGRAKEELTSRAVMERELRALSAEAAAATAGFLTTFDRLRFAPSPPTATDRVRLVSDARVVVERIDQLPPAGAPVELAVPVALFVAAMLAATSVAAPVAAQTGFQRGVAAYASEDFPNAIAAFESYVETRPHDANAWYDLGNAYYRDGKPGDAAWAWLQALRMEPRHDDARTNLLLAGGAAYGLVPAPFMPSREEAILLAVVLLWCGALLFSSTRVSERGRRAGLVVVVVLGCAAVLSMALDPMHGHAIARSSATPLLAGPALRADQIESLPARTPVDVIEQRGAWLRVRTPSGAEGWMEATLVRQL